MVLQHISSQIQSKCKEHKFLFSKQMNRKRIGFSCYYIGSIKGFRYVQVFLLFLALTHSFFTRANIGISVVAMTDYTPIDPEIEIYNWNFNEKQLILSSFNWGYVLTQLPGGYLTHKFGAKIILCISLLGTTVFQALVPLCISIGEWKAYCVIRVFQGLFQGALFPTTIDLLSKWCPKEERSLLGAMAFSGIRFGMVLGVGASGFIAGSEMGWPGISYICGAFGLITTILFSIFGANSPKHSKFITDEERKYIESSLEDKSNVKHQAIPWREIFTSTPYWALLCIVCCQEFGAFIVLSEIPIYLDTIMNYDIENNAIFSSLPHLSGWLMAYVCLIIGYFIRKHNLLSLAGLRKTFSSLSVMTSVVVFIALGFLDEEFKTLAVVLIVINSAFYGTYDIAYDLNIIDLSPNFSSLLIAIMNTLSFMVDLIGPFIVALIISDQEVCSRWCYDCNRTNNVLITISF